MTPKKTSEVSALGQVWDLALWAVKSISPIASRAEKALEKYKSASQKWVFKVVFRGFLNLLSLTFLILGLFFIAIDYGGIPRGIVFACGGILGLLILRLMVPSTN